MADLPAHRVLNNPKGNGGHTGDEDGSNRREQLNIAVNWDDREAFRAAVVGYPQTFTMGGVTYTRRIPLEHPYTPGLYAVAASFKSQGAKNVSSVRPYNTAVYRVTFGYLPYGVGGDAPFQSLQEVGSSRSITDPSRRYQFDNSPESINHGVQVTYSGVSFLFTQYGMSDAVLQSFRNAARPLLKTPVNDAPLTIAGQTFGAGEICFETYSVQQSTSMFGVTETAVTAVLNWSELPWNSFVRSDGVIDTVSPKPKQTGDLSALMV